MSFIEPLSMGRHAELQKLSELLRRSLVRSRHIALKNPLIDFIWAHQMKTLHQEVLMFARNPAFRRLNPIEDEDELVAVRNLLSDLQDVFDIYVHDHSNNDVDVLAKRMKREGVAAWAEEMGREYDAAVEGLRRSAEAVAKAERIKAQLPARFHRPLDIAIPLLLVWPWEARIQYIRRNFPGPVGAFHGLEER